MEVELIVVLYTSSEKYTGWKPGK